MPIVITAAGELTAPGGAGGGGGGGESSSSVGVSGDNNSGGSSSSATSDVSSHPVLSGGGYPMWAEDQVMMRGQGSVAPGLG